MPDFLDTLDEIHVSTERRSDLFSIHEEGQRLTTLRKNTPRYKRAIVECVKLMAGVISGRTRAYILREAMTSSDFPLLFGDILDRSVLAQYTEWPTVWEPIAKRVVLQDFRDAKIFPPTWGADGPLDEVTEDAQYPAAAIYEQTPLTWAVKKYGRTIPFSWESIINDDLNQLKDMPTRLGRAARRTENDLITRLYVDASGPHASLYTSGNANIINTTNGASVDNPPLSITGLSDAMIVLNSMVDENGEPIMREVTTLVVPPALEITAMNILNAVQIWGTSVPFGGAPDNSSGSGYQQLNVANWMKGRFQLVVNPYLPFVATTNGNTSWFLFADPNYSREALRIGFLSGYETPQLWMKSPNAVRIGGGLADPMDGDFETDSINYKIRHVIAATRIDGKATVASNGSGS